MLEETREDEEEDFVFEIEIEEDSSVLDLYARCHGQLNSNDGSSGETGYWWTDGSAAQQQQEWKLPKEAAKMKTALLETLSRGDQNGHENQSIHTATGLEPVQRVTEEKVKGHRSSEVEGYDLNELEGSEGEGQSGDEDIQIIVEVLEDPPSSSSNKCVTDTEQVSQCITQQDEDIQNTCTTITEKTYNVCDSNLSFELNSLISTQEKDSRLTNSQQCEGKSVGEEQKFKCSKKGKERIKTLSDSHSDSQKSKSKSSRILPSHRNERMVKPRLGKRGRKYGIPNYTTEEAVQRLLAGVDVVIQVTDKGVEEKRYRCPHCGKDFRLLGNLKTHIFTHTGEKPYKCDICDRAFNNPSNLATHRDIHNPDRQFPCPECGLAFKSSRLLAKHIPQHRNTKTYACDLCHKRFPSRSALGIHTRRHMGQKPFSCEVCGRGFADNGALSRHKYSLHSLEEKYKCEVCKKTFSRKDNMLSHRKRAH